MNVYGVYGDDSKTMKTIIMKIIVCGATGVTRRRKQKVRQGSSKVHRWVQSSSKFSCFHATTPLLRVAMGSRWVSHSTRLAWQP